MDPILSMYQQAESGCRWS